MRIQTFVLALLASVSLLAQNFTPQDLQRVQRINEIAMAPDAGTLVYVVNIKRALKDGKGSDKRELYVRDVYRGEDKLMALEMDYFYNLQWRPGTEQVSFLARAAGSSGKQVMQVHILDLEEGDVYPITESATSISSYEWHPKGKMLAYIASDEQTDGSALRKLGFDAEVFEEDMAQSNVYLMNTESGQIDQLTTGVSAFSIAWDPKGALIAAQIAPTSLVDDSYMSKRINLIDPISKKRWQLIDNPGKLTEMAWSTDGAYLAFVSAVDKHDPVSGSLYIIERDNKKSFTELHNYTEDFEGSVTELRWKDGRTLLFASDESVDRTIRSVRVGGTHSMVLAGGYLVPRDLEYAAGKLAFVADSKDHPYELFITSLSSPKPERLTNSNPWLKDMRMAKQEKITWTAADGLRVEGTLVYPLNYQAGMKYPLITYVHGGPEACQLNTWITYYSTWGQIAAARGYFVFYPNYRSSSGRGVAYSKMGFGDLADEEFTDILDGIDHLIAEGKVDPKRVGIGGGSYGGYFSGWAATKHSKRFAAAVSFVGVSNQISKRNTTDIPMEDYLVHWGIWTNEDLELIYDRSPVKYAHQQETPILILHGKNDPRVHPSQSLELYRQLKLHGKAPVRLVWYPGEGHGNRNNPARMDYAIRTMEWFDYYLMGNNDHSAMPPSELNYGTEVYEGAQGTN